MQTNSVTSTNFRALNVSEVLYKDKRYIQANKKALEKLGESYDINIKSKAIMDKNAKDGYYYALEIFVATLCEGMNFLQKIANRKGSISYSRIPANDVVEQTQKAINKLETNL